MAAPQEQQAPVPAAAPLAGPGAKEKAQKAQKAKNYNDISTFLAKLFKRVASEHKETYELKRNSLDVLQTATYEMMHMMAVELTSLMSTISSARRKKALITQADAEVVLTLMFDRHATDLLQTIRGQYNAHLAKYKEWRQTINHGAGKEPVKKEAAPAAGKAPKMSLSKRVGLTLPIVRIKKRFRKAGLKPSLSSSAAIVLDSALEGFVMHWIRQALAYMQSCKKSNCHLSKQHLDQARLRDRSLHHFLPHQTVLISNTTGIGGNPDVTGSSSSISTESSAPSKKRKRAPSSRPASKKTKPPVVVDPVAPVVGESH